MDQKYFDCKNGVKRNAQDALKNLLAKLGIKSARKNYILTGANAALYINGKKIAYATGVSYAVNNPGPITLLDPIDIDAELSGGSVDDGSGS